MSHRGGYSAARPKRAGETFARTHHQEGDQPDSKKPRFDARNPSILAPDAPEEDDVLEADVIGKGAATKRNAVNIDGYDSDSSNDNFNERADAKAKAAKEATSKDEEDEDMFADLEEADGDQDEDLDREGKTKKNVKFIDVDGIDGVVSSSKSGGHVNIELNGRKGADADDDSSSESGSDEERDRLPNNVDEELGAGHKKKHAPKLDAFNMRAEGEEGRFDENGNFVRKAADPDAVHDTWLEGISKKEMKRAADAHAKREEEDRQRRLADDEILTADLLKLLIQNLEPVETPLEALQRHNKGRKQHVPKWKQKKLQQSGKAVDTEDGEDQVEKQKQQAIDQITDASTKLMNRGTDDIYEQERELLMRWYKRETGEDWVDEKSATAVNAQYEFRYSQDPDLTVNGPYDKQTLESWIDQGQFAAAVQFKRVGGAEWSETIDDD